MWYDLREDVSLVVGSKDPLPGQGTFNHIVGGYDAGYYGYMYSLVFAADMYATVFKQDPLDPTLGEKYKNSILLPGGSRDELDSLTVRRCAAPTKFSILNGTDPFVGAGVPRSSTERRSLHEGIVR